MNVTSGDYLGANIYQACNNEFRKSVHINRAKLSQSSHHEVTQSKTGKLDIILDRDANDIDNMFLSKGTAIPPDEILLYVNKTRLKIPIKHREEFPSHNQLPSSDLLNVLHYYTSDKVSQSKINMIMERSCDETALLAFGVMVELWIDDAVSDNVMRLFLEKEEQEIKPDIFNDEEPEIGPEGGKGAEEGDGVSSFEDSETDSALEGSDENV